MPVAEIDKAGQGCLGDRLNKFQIKLFLLLFAAALPILIVLIGIAERQAGIGGWQNTAVKADIAALETVTAAGKGQRLQVCGQVC